jgi:hypothetical protein
MGGAGGSLGSAGTTGTAGSAGTAGNAGAAGAAGNAGTGAVGPNTLDIVDPTEGEVHVQSGAPPRASVSFSVSAGPNIASVEYVIENGFSLGVATTPPNFALDYVYEYTGNRWAEAHGFDAGGAEVATDLVNFVVQGPVAGGCLGELDALGVGYMPTQAKGVADAVNLTGPLNGVIFASGTGTSVTGDPIACEFIKQLWQFAALLKERGFDRVGTLGSYCYRCCCAWSSTNYCRGPSDPEPSCGSDGYSNHSWGRAVDVRYLHKSDGTTYDVNNTSHFVEWTGSGDTCGPGVAAQSGISRELYDLVCEASARQIFSTTLTPNYNAAHRNHFHLDIGQSGPPSGFVVRSSGMPNVDLSLHGDE